MSTIDKRISELEAFRERQERTGRRKKSNPEIFIDEISEMLQGIDGQAELGMLPGENIMDVMTRRMQRVDGYDLSGMPGDTLKAKRANVELAFYDKVVVSPAATHAARAYFKLFDYV